MIRTIFRVGTRFILNQKPDPVPTAVTESALNDGVRKNILRRQTFIVKIVWKLYLPAQNKRGTMLLFSFVKHWRSYRPYVGYTY